MTKSPEHLRLIKYYTLSGFFVIGVITLLLGQILPILSARLDLTDAEAGTLFLAQFSGSILGTFVSTHIASRYGFTLTVLIGLFLIIAGLPGINSQEFAVCWVAIFVYGSGLGVTIPGINLLTIESTETHLRSSAVNLINFSWGVGAICSQPFVAAVSRDQSLVSVTVILGGALFLLAIAFFSAVRRFPHQARAVRADAPKTSRIWRKPSSWLFVAFGFFVVSVEGGLGGWLTTYSEVLKLRGVHTINLTVIYFLFFVLGRGVASIVSRRVSENSLILSCSIILLAGVLIIVLSESWSIVGAAVAGLGSSALFPTHMVRFARIFGPQATLQAAPIFIAGTSGAAVVSSLVGFVSSASGSLRTGITVVVISAVFILILHLVIAAVFRPAPQAAGSGSV
jgi:MFS transporter, FHS family, glucose/mannose:H+ symporter